MKLWFWKTVSDLIFRAFVWADKKYDDEIGDGDFDYFELDQ
jgi:hypothetical protein